MTRRLLATELDYELPEERIAERPPPERDGGRLLVLGDALSHHRVADWPQLVPRGALVVLNDTRVMPARIFARRPESGGQLELLLLQADPEDARRWQALVKSNRAPQPGERVEASGVGVVFEARLEQGGQGGWWVVIEGDAHELMSRHGHVPLPPYVRRPDDAADRERYQTVFARHRGSAAAPTAGLHLSQSVLEALAAREIEIAYVTLHVGAGTFRPVRSETVEEHPMHRERFEVSAECVERIRRARERSAKVVAVGTTVVRALESSVTPDGELRSSLGSTELLITPGYQFRVVDALLTNFHAPKSTLLALVFAFAGIERTRAAYAAALASEYRFLSYGDAMWIPQRSA